MRPEGSDYSKEVSLEEAVKHYNEGKKLIIRFFDQEWYASYVQNKNHRTMNTLGSITLDMLPHARYFIKGE